MEKTIRPDSNGNQTEDTGAEKTMRPVEEVEKTMRPITHADKTMRPDVDKTQRPNADSTLRPAQQEEINKIVNQQETEFILNKVKYQVVKIISDGTGEAQIYLLENNGKQFALKLYYVGIQPPPNHNIMEIVRQSSKSGLLVETIDHSQWTNPQTGDVRDYELMEYCAGGSLDQLKINDNEQLLGEIALKCGAALDFMHKKNIIHRDVKPANFFFKKEGQKIDDLVLGDFGIAIECDKNGKVVIDYQLRTKIYAAPETYSPIDGKIEIYTKSDFYSLGMMLLTLINGEEIFKINEFELVNLKRYGKLPYPKNLSDRSLQLIKALTQSDPNTRAGFAEIVRWAKGETIFDLNAGNTDVRQLNIMFDEDKKLVARSPEDLAKFMFEDKELGMDYLYHGKIKDWLEKSLRSKMAMAIDKISDTMKDVDGLFAACYLLDPNMPYYDVKNQPLTDSKEIALSLRNNAQHYEKVLANKTDSLFLFFNSHGASNITDKFAPVFKKKDNEDALRQLIFTLDPSLSWIVTNEEKQIFECQTPEDVINVFYKEDVNDNSWKALIGESFLTWLSTRNIALEGKIRSQQGHDTSAWCVLYNLSPKVAYNLQMDETADDYYFTHTQVASIMNTYLTLYIKDENSYASSQLDYLCNIDETPLYYYFKSKGVYNDKIDWIRYCGDIKSKDNTKKAGPYNWKIGVYKAIKGLDYDPHYYFPKSDKYVKTLEGLAAIPAQEVKEEIEKGYLTAWLTVHYQENPSLNLKPKFTFEKECVKFIEHLEKLAPQDAYVYNYRIGTKYVNQNQKAVNRNHKTLLWSKILFGTLTMLLTGLVIYGLITLQLPESVKNAPWINVVGNVVGIIVGICVGLYLWSKDWGFIISCIVGLVAYAVVMFLIVFLLSLLQYVLAGALGVLLIWSIIAALIKNNPSAGNKLLRNPGFEEKHVEPLYFAFHAKGGETYKSSIGQSSESVAWCLKDGIKTFYKWFGSLLGATLICGCLLIYFSPNFEFDGAKMVQEARKYATFEGRWEGKFDKKEAILTITKVSKETAEASIYVKYKKPISEKIKGTINYDKKTVHFDDVNRTNGNLDGEYNGTFNKNFTKFEGTFQNYKTKKKTAFVFGKTKR
ncbi:hypothetical protein AGMMS49982_13850 [Bacteroidia bacterium]|nr:hypothetical protein AGMMS49982_13850 [Bacteroidia bacterium]